MSDEARPDEARAEAADRLHSAAIHLLRLVRREDTASGLSPARLSALSVLVFGGPRTVGELAAAEQVRSPTMSRLVAEMERDRLVERTASSDDRRSVVVSATAAGRQVLFAGRRRRVATLAARLETLDDGEVAVLDQAAAIVERLARDDSHPGS
ncbi:MAG: MarR family winged helix-turn-helix transcriptional regulator [Acidimicrobiales bacterium]